jgi:hypothetical protein
MYALVHAKLPQPHVCLHFLENFYLKAEGVNAGGEVSYYLTCLQAAVANVRQAPVPEWAAAEAAAVEAEAAVWGGAGGGGGDSGSGGGGGGGGGSGGGSRAPAAGIAGTPAAGPTAGRSDADTLDTMADVDESKLSAEVDGDQTAAMHHLSKWLGQQKAIEDTMDVLW